MTRQLPDLLSLSDIEDVEAYVRKIVATIDVEDGQEFEELVADGLELVIRRDSELAPGQSLQRALSSWLARRLRDRQRIYHREWRRNSRGGTSYSIPVPTQLAWDYGGEPTGLSSSDHTSLIESRLSLDLFQQEADLRDPHLTGRYNSVPSWKAVSTGLAHDIWLRIQEERNLTTPEPAPRFRFHRGPFI
jgi:hypothetical protein